MIVEPKIRGFICTTAHPLGCAENVSQQIKTVQAKPSITGPKKVLIIGASTGYGLASRISAAFGANAATIGVSFERPAAGKRTATAGWYNTAAFEQAASAKGLYAKSINGDAFSTEIKNQTIELIREDWQGEVDLVIYSLASPRRTHPITGEVFNSTLQPIGKTYTNKTVNTQTGEVTTISIEPATEEQIHQTEQVMGGEDWSMWMQALNQAGVLAKNVITLAYSYIGPEMTFPIYRDGSIGAAKKHLAKSANDITKQLSAINGKAFISVNKALVTQASSAIPVVPLYISILYKIMKAKNLHEGCIEQMSRLFQEKLYQNGKIITDAQNLIRLDDWEMRDDVQAEVSKIWNQISTENIPQLADLAGYQHEFQRLFGFDIQGVNYAADVDVEIPIPSITQDEIA
ncbi:MAG: trans-2-enoyl-CoA reductase family protein [Pseudomonadota bacterium]|nr:trans-2-enoyl-CoA reductase family protein [Pseudomonadota bacterium]